MRPACLGNEMRIEFQLSADKLRTLLLQRLRAKKICFTGEIPFGDDSLVLDHVEIPDTGTFSREEGHDVVIHVPGGQQTIDGTKVRFSQPVILHVVKLRTLGDGPSPSDLPPVVTGITLFLDLTMAVTDGVPRLRAKLAEVDARFLGVFTKDIVPTLESKLAFEVQSDLDLSAVADLLGTAVTATNAGMVIAPDLTRVSMRIEVNGTTDEVAAWESFFDDALPDHLAGRDWSILIDGALIVPVVERRIGEGVAGAPGFRLQSGPSGAWSWADGPAVDIRFGGEAVDACTCLFWESDVDVDVRVRVSLSVPVSDTLRMDATISFSPSAAEVGCCVLTSTLFWPVVGAVVLADEGGDWGKFLGGLAGGPLVVFIGALLAASDHPLPDATPVSCTKISDTQVRCEQRFALSAGLGRLTLDTIGGLPEGLLLAGTIYTGVPLETPQISTKVGGFTWHLGGSCGSGFGAVCDAGIEIRRASACDVAVCEVRVLDDLLGVYEASFGEPQGEPGPVVAVVAIRPKPTDAFLADPYPCRVLIQTTGGARIITIPDPQPITIEQQHALELAAIQRKADCKRLVDPFWAATGRLKPEWIPDPPPESVSEHLWQVLAMGMHPGDQLVATDHADHALATATAGARGAAQVSVLTAPLTGGAGELGLTRVPQRGARLAPDDRRRLMIKQVLLVRRATFPSAGQATSIGAGHLRGVPVVFAVDGDGLRVYDVGRLPAPYLAQSLRARGLRGALLWRDGLVLWGEAGLAVLAAGQSRVGLGNLHAVGPVRDLVRIGDHLAVLTDDGVSVLDEDLGRTTVIPAIGTWLATAGPRLLVGTAAGLDAYELVRSAAPRREASHASAGGRAMRAPATGDAKDVLFARREAGGGTVVHVRPEGLTELARYERDPWYVGAARVGRTIGRLVEQGTRLAIDHIARTAEL